MDLVRREAQSKQHKLIDTYGDGPSYALHARLATRTLDGNQTLERSFLPALVRTYNAGLSFALFLFFLFFLFFLG
jgi:hypothetical protein